MTYYTPPMLSASFTPQGKRVKRRLEHIFKHSPKGGKLLPVAAVSVLLLGSLVACSPVLTASVQLPAEPVVTEKTEAVCYAAPLENETTILASYGKRTHPIFGVEADHSGVDLSAAEGDAVLAAADGTVLRAEYDNVYGNYVLLSHGDGRESFYGHLKNSGVIAGEVVSCGDEIGEVGQTGFATAPHLHFEIREDGVCLDPTDIVS